jgi:hypothetical protein
MTWTEKILDFLFRYLSVFTDKKLLAAEGAAHFCLDKDFYYIDNHEFVITEFDCKYYLTKFNLL